MLCASFFSYKGGSGRTSLLYNVLPILAEELQATKEEPIIVLDMDVDSKGLSYIVDKRTEINTVQVLMGDDSLLADTDCALHDHPFFRKLKSIGEVVGLNKDKDDAILFVSAHATSDENRYINSQDNYDTSFAGMQSLMTLCQAYNCKAVIMDTPSGYQLTGKISIDSSKKIITVMRITTQFKKGTIEFLRDYQHNASNKEFIVVPNAVPSDIGTTYQASGIINTIKNQLKDIKIENKNKINYRMLDPDINGINEVQLFKFAEHSLVKLKKERETNNRSLNIDESEALSKYQILVKEITNG